MRAYDWFACIYDAALEPLYAAHRVLAADALAVREGMVVLDLPCGTGQSFETLVPRVGAHGWVLGVDASTGMLRRARERVRARRFDRVRLHAGDARRLDRSTLGAGVDHALRIDRLHVFLGMTVFEPMQDVFDHLWDLLEPGGRCVLVDVHARKLGLQGRAVNRIARADIRRRFWEPLERVAVNFELRDLPYRHQHGGQIMLACGDKPGGPDDGGRSTA